MKYTKVFSLSSIQSFHFPSDEKRKKFPVQWKMYTSFLLNFVFFFLLYSIWQQLTTYHSRHCQTNVHFLMRELLRSRALKAPHLFDEGISENFKMTNSWSANLSFELSLWRFISRDPLKLFNFKAQWKFFNLIFLCEFLEM